MKEQQAEMDKIQHEREMMQIESLKREIEVMKTEVQDQIGTKIGKDSRTFKNSDAKRTNGSLPKHFPSGEQIDTPASFNAFVNNKLIPNVITQYNLR